MGHRTIEYFYSAHSAFAWIGSEFLRDIARRHSCEIRHRPFDFRPVIAAANGGVYPVFGPARTGYFFGREIDRWAAWRGAKTIHTRPEFHDAPLVPASRLIIAAQDAGEDAMALSHAILGAHWRDDADISNREVLLGLCAAAGLDCQAVFARADTAEVMAKFTQNTAEAIARDVFGSPTYFVDGDMFYGQDRLEMLERALTRPFARF